MAKPTITPAEKPAVAAPVAAPAAPAAPAKPAFKGVPRGEVKRFTVKLRDPKGVKQLKATCEQRKDGKFISFAVQSTVGEGGKLKFVARGATTEHADFTAAKKGVEELAKAAESRGWVRQRHAGPFAAGPRPDTFDLSSLPAAE